MWEAGCGRSVESDAEVAAILMLLLKQRLAVAAGGVALPTATALRGEKYNYSSSAVNCKSLTGYVRSHAHVYRVYHTVRFRRVSDTRRSKAERLSAAGESLRD